MLLYTRPGSNPFNRYSGFLQGQPPDEGTPGFPVGTATV